MSLKLIREAQLRTTLSDADITALSVIKDATGVGSIVDLVGESFTPSTDDFDAWMRVVVGEAQARGVNLNKKSNFMELVMDVLENDPAMPPIDMQEAIASKLWQDYQSAKNEVRINKIAAAKEEEEKVEAAKKQIADRFAREPSARIHALAVRNAYDEEESGFAQAFKVAKGIEDEEHTSFLSDVLKTRNTRAGVRSPTSFSNHLRGFEDEQREPEFDEIDPEVVDADPGVFTSADNDLDFDDRDDTFTDDECECSCDDVTGNTPDDELDLPSDEIIDHDADMSDEVEVPHDERKKGYDEEEAVKSFFRQAATAPRNMMTQAIKDIESEGASAWKQANVPANPHPKKSAAYRAWQKGLLAAAKESLGITDKPKDMKPKKKK